ncbi:MAG: hypothetical protein ABC596_05805 [Candidatus Methanosuratincola petrocarbonis]
MKAWNRTDLDHEYILKAFLQGRSQEDIGREFSVSPIVISRHLHEIAGDDYKAIIKAHWKALASQRAKKRAGKRMKGGGRWFTFEEEKAVIQFYLTHTASYQAIADYFKCSRVVIKRLVEREIDEDIRKKKHSELRRGRRLVTYKTIVCPVCGRAREVPPWKERQRLTFCSKQCAYQARSGTNSHLWGKTNHAVGAWFKLPDGSQIWLRSKWEYGVATYLTKEGHDWTYEPHAFPILVDGKHTTYTPDFYLSRTQEYIEVKGYWRPAYQKKYRAFRRTYPTVNFTVWDRAKLMDLGIIDNRGHLISSYSPG